MFASLKCVSAYPGQRREEGGRVAGAYADADANSLAKSGWRKNATPHGNNAAGDWAREHAITNAGNGMGTYLARLLASRHATANGRLTAAMSDDQRCDWLRLEQDRLPSCIVRAYSPLLTASHIELILVAWCSLPLLTTRMPSHAVARPNKRRRRSMSGTVEGPSPLHHGRG